MKRTLSLILALIIVFMALPFSASAQKNAQSIVFKNDTLTKYKDGDYYRYYGPTGGIVDENYDNATAVISDSDDYVEIIGRNKDIASTGAENLPDAVDLSQTKYFPPVGNQGGLGSCAAFSAVYYQFSYAVNKIRDVVATYENTRSPQIVYNFVNAGANTGTYHEDHYKFLSQFGAVTMAEVPYTDQDYLNWYAEKGIWREGIRARLKDYYLYDDIGYTGTEITSVDDPDLDVIKASLNDGMVVGYSTYVYSWAYTKIKTNPAAPENNKFVNEEVVLRMDGTSGPHGMAIVGYNDNIWVDVNENDKVDNGEMGAFKIVNSWGDSYCNSGFAWVCYDALNKVSQVEGTRVTNREPIFSALRTITAREYNDNSDIYIRYTLNTAKRTQHNLVFTAEKDGTEHKYQMFYGAGGGYTNAAAEGAFDGTDTASDGEFVCPIDLIDSDFTYDDFEKYNFSVEIFDTNEDGNTLLVKSVELVNERTNTVYKVNEHIPALLDGSSITYEIKAPTTNNKVIYYTGFDTPTLHYSTDGVNFESVKMEENKERIGSVNKFVIESTKQDVTLYFTDESGNVDNNNGQYFTAKDRLNFYRTQGVRAPLVIEDVKLPEEFDTGLRFYFNVETTGGYEPYTYQHTIENIETGEVKMIYFDNGKIDKSHVFYNAGQYRIKTEVYDQAGDTYTFEKVYDIVDMPFVFKSMTPNNAIQFVGDTSAFTVETMRESIISRGPEKSLYQFDVKDENGNLVYTKTNKCTSFHMGEKWSIVDFEYIPEKAGTYTLTVSSTDGNNDYAEISLDFTVFDKIYGDSNSDGEVSVMDATLIQRMLAGVVTKDDVNEELSDVDANSDIDVMDATLIQRYMAQLSGTKNTGNIIEYIPPVEPTEPPTEPTQPTQPPTEPPVTKNTVTFTNSLRWSGQIRCYYWSDSNKSMTAWPGAAMTFIGVNDYGQSVYTFEVPKDATYIIFTDGSKQTIDISYPGGEIKYYATEQTDNSGHHKVNTW